MRPLPLHLAAIQGLDSQLLALREVARSPKWMALAMVAGLVHVLGGLLHPQPEWSGAFGAGVLYAVFTVLGTALILGSIARASEHVGRLLASMGFGGHLYLAWAAPCLSQAPARCTSASPVVADADPSRPTWPRP